MPNIFISNHPLIQHKLSLLREKDTQPKEFRALVNELGTLLCYEATRDFPLVTKDIETPLMSMRTNKIRERIALVPILRAGLGMVDGVWNLIPTAVVLHIGLYRDEDTLKDLLYHDSTTNKTYVVKRQRRGVKEAELRYRRLQTQSATEGEISLLRVELVTGRSHQIRVQFASRKLPLVGDSRYGSSYRSSGIALWCEQLSFPHPKSGEMMTFTCPPPDEWPWKLFSVK